MKISWNTRDEVWFKGSVVNRYKKDMKNSEVQVPACGFVQWVILLTFPFTFMKFTNDINLR